MGLLFPTAVALPGGSHLNSIPEADVGLWWVQVLPGPFLAGMFLCCSRYLSWYYFGPHPFLTRPRWVCTNLHGAHFLRWLIGQPSPEGFGLVFGPGTENLFPNLGLGLTLGAIYPQLGMVWTLFCLGMVSKLEIRESIYKWGQGVGGTVEATSSSMVVHSLSELDLKKGQLFDPKQAPIGPPMGSRNPQNLALEPSQKASWKTSRKSVGEGFTFEPNDWPKLHEGFQKSRLPRFRKRSCNGAPQASIFHAFWGTFSTTIAS